MNVDDFTKWARQKGEPLRVDEVSIATPTGDFAGRGTLRAQNGNFSLKVTLSGTAELPQVSGSYTREQFWKIQGRIEEKLPFQAEGLSASRLSHQGHFSIQQAQFNLHHLSFVTDQTRAEDEATAKLLYAHEEFGKPAGFWGRAFLEGHQLISRNASTTTKTVNEFLGERSCLSVDTFKADFDEFESAIIRVENDCEAYLRTKEGGSVDEERFRETFAAFLTAIAFLHGREAWPQHFTIRSGIRTLLDEVYPVRKLGSTPWCLLSERTCVHGADFGQALVSATRLFLRKDLISNAVQRALYLCRQSSLRSAPLDVGTLSLCAVFEGLVGKLHQILAAPDLTPDAIAFNSARDELLVVARRRESEGTVAFARLIGLLSGAKPYRLKDALLWLAAHLELRWEPEMKEAFDAWNSERNALAHGNEPDNGASDRMKNQSRLAGGLNLIVARLIGYSGPAVFSAVEDRFIRLEPRAA